MKFGVREICDVVLKAKANQKVGNKIFYKGEPVIYFDTLKTSSMEGAATTVYAQGGRGNSRLVAWEGERTITFTMEDALISPAGFMILSGAGLIDGSEKPIQVHVAETTANTVVVGDIVYIGVEQKPSAEPGASIYVMALDDNGDANTEPYIGEAVEATVADGKVSIGGTAIDGLEIAEGYIAIQARAAEIDEENNKVIVPAYTPSDIKVDFATGNAVLVDYYTDKVGAGVQQINITPDKFGGNYYLEASTLFRDTNGVDMPAEFIIPNCKIQSNFTFTMASSGDPSTFTFTMDAFPDYTRFNKTEKVLAAIQIIGTSSASELVRESTKASHTHGVTADGIVFDKEENIVEGD